MKIRHALWIATFLASLNLCAPAATLYVSLNSTNPVPPYASWSTAATNIQDAIDASTNGDLILVTNGVYQTGGRVVHGSLSNRVAINKAITVQSVNGPAVTLIQGYQVPGSTVGDNAVRCVYLTNNATLIGFTLTNGAARGTGDGDTEMTGAGAWAESTNATLINCVLTGNSLGWGASGGGGGVSHGTLSNCILIGNLAWNGGGAAWCTLNNCTLSLNNAFGGGGAFEAILSGCILTNNSAAYGAGVHSCTLTHCLLTANRGRGGGGGGAAFSTVDNCVVVGNSDKEIGGGAYDCTVNNCTIVGNSPDGNDGSTVNNCIEYFNAGSDSYSSYSYCCTDQLSANDGNNFTNAPLFINLAGSDFHLQSNSPCINAGNNAYVVGRTDLDGRARIVGGTVDIGACEFQAPFNAWLQQYSLPANGSADFIDSDGDGLNNYQEYVAGTNPTNALSVLQLQAPTQAIRGWSIIWQSVSDRTYFLQSSTNLAAQPAFSTIQSNIVGKPDLTRFTDVGATNAGPYFYRVGVQQ